MRGVRYLLICLFLLVSSPAQSSIDAGITWLQSQAAGDGSFSSADISSPLQGTAEAYGTQVSVGKLSPSATLQWILGAQAQTTEELSRKIIVLAGTGADVTNLVTTLLSAQNMDGGFGEGPGFQSTAIDTAYALNALASAKASGSNRVAGALMYLQSIQLSDGSFDLFNANTSSVYVTAVASTALQRWRLVFQVNNTIAAANAYLVKQRGLTGGWGSDWETAVSLLALAPAGADVTLLQPAIAALADAQASDGSWGGSVYVTSLSLQALSVASGLTKPQDLGTLTGRVLDQSSNLPVIATITAVAGGRTWEAATGPDGSFSMAVPANEYSLTIRSAGYVPLTLTSAVQTAQIVSLGTLALGLNPSFATVSGVVTDGSTGQPIAGAQVVATTGTGTQTAMTGTDGHYSLSLSGGVSTLSASASGYAPVSLQATLSLGTLFGFSPVLTGSPATGPVTVRGKVVDIATGLPLSGATVQVTGGSSASTDPTGAFTLTGISAGQVNLQVAAVGYLSAQISILAPEGESANLGLIRLTSSTAGGGGDNVIAGYVTDFDTGTPIALASVTAGATRAITDANGHFSLNAGTQTQLTLVADAVGYIPMSSNLTLSRSGTSAVNFSLHRSGVADFSITEISTASPSYGANEDVPVVVVFKDSGTTDYDVSVTMEVIDSAGNVVESYRSQDMLTQVIHVDAGTQFTYAVPWNTKTRAPGNYGLAVHAYDAGTGQLLAERGHSVGIDATLRLGGITNFDPPISVENSPVHVTADVVNVGNLPLEAGTATLTIRVQNAGPVQPSFLNTKLVAQQNGPRGMARDAAGNTYVANYNSGVVTQIRSDGTASVFMSGLVKPVDVFLGADGFFYALNESGSYVRRAPDGATSTTNTGLAGQVAIAAKNGNVFVATAKDVYEFKPDGTNVKLTSASLSSPKGMAVNSKGEVYVASYGTNAISKYADGRLSAFVTGIPNPQGLAVDGADNLYVTSFTENTLYRVSPAGQVTLLASGFSGPYDVKVGGDGTLYVSNNNGNSLVKVDAAGRSTPLVPRGINEPRAMAFGASGDLYTANEGYKQIARIDQSGNVTQLGAYDTTAVDMVAAADGIYLLTTASLYRMNGDGSLAKVTSFAQGTALMAAPNDGVYVASAGGQVSQVTSSGAVTTVAMPAFGSSPQAIRSDGAGGFYVQNANSIAHVDASFNTKVFSVGVSSVPSLASGPDGRVYIADISGRRVVGFDSSGAQVSSTSLAFVPGPVAACRSGDLYVAQSNSSQIYKIAGGAVVPHVTLPGAVSGDMLCDSNNVVWATSTSAGKVYSVDGGVVATYSGFSSPKSLNPAVDGNVLVMGTNELKRVNKSTGAIATVLTSPTLSGGYAGAVQNGNGDYLVLRTDGLLSQFNASLNLVAKWAPLLNPTAMISYGGQFLVSDRFGLVQFDAGKLPRLWSDRTGRGLGLDGAGNVLLSSLSGVVRLDSNGSATSLISGYSGLWRMASDPVFGIAVGDLNTNVVAFHAQDGSRRRDYMGLLSPRGVAVSASGTVYVGTSGGILAVGSDGHMSRFGNVGGDVRYLSTTSTGGLLATSVNALFETDSNGRIVSSLYTTIILKQPHQGIVPTAGGPLFVADNGSIYAWNGASITSLVSGTGQLADLAVDSDGTLLAADTLSGQVASIGEDGNLGVAYRDLPSVTGLAIYGNDLLASYATNNVAHFDGDGTRSEYPTAQLFKDKITAITLADDGQAVFAAFSKNALYSMYPSVAPAVPTQPGTVVFSQVVSHGELTGGKRSLDFGNWSPSLSGDYVATVEFDQGAASTVTGNIHVGATASGTMSVGEPLLPAGDQAGTAYLRVSGFDPSTVARIDASQLSYIGAYEGYGAMAADSQGNVYASGPWATYRVSPGGDAQKILSTEMRWGMAVDDEDNLYGLGSINGMAGVLRITPDGQVTNFVPVSNGTGGSVVYANGHLYTRHPNLDSDEIYITSVKDGSTRVLPTSGGGGAILAANDEGTMFTTYPAWPLFTLHRVLPDGTTSLYHALVLEGEAQAITTDCTGNLLYAPLVGGREEESVYQVDDATGRVTKIFDGLGVLPAPVDIDALYYDRFGQRLLMWTSFYSNGIPAIYSFPITCGGVTASVNLVTRGDVDLNSATPSPASSSTLPSGEKVFTWNLEDVNKQGQGINLNVFFHNLAEGEVRPLVKDAYITMLNAFVPGQAVKVPIAIPSVTAASGITLGLALDNSSYGEGQPVNIALALKNGSAASFAGTVETSIFDGEGKLVQALPAVPAEGVLAFSEADYTSVWNTGNTYAGSYKVQAVVKNTAGEVVATQSASLKIAAGNGTGTGAFSATLAADKLVYDAWGPVRVSATVLNDAANATYTPSAATLLVTRADGSVVYSGSAMVGALYPKAVTTVPFSFWIADEPAGTLTATFVVVGSDGLSLATAGTNFTVSRTPTAGLVGFVDVAQSSVYQGDTNTCTETVTNYGRDAIDPVTIRHQLVAMESGQVLQEKSNERTLAGNGTQVEAWSVSTQGMPVGDYGCVLSVQVGGASKNLGLGGFMVKAPPVKIDAGWLTGTKGRLLVLLDKAANDDHHCDHHSLRLRADHGMVLGKDARVEVRLLDAKGKALVKATAANDGTWKSGSGGDGRLSIEAFDRNGLTVNVGEEADQGYAVEATVVSAGNTLRFATGPMHHECGHDHDHDHEHDRGQSFGDFTVVEAKRVAANDAHDLPPAPELAAQRAQLESLLQAEGWNYTLVDDAEAFANAFHHGGYSAYLLLNERVKLPEALQSELVEAVNRGEGLLVAGEHDHHNNRLDEALGVVFRGHHAKADGITIAGTDWLNAGEAPFAAATDANEIGLAGATVISRYTGLDRHGDGHDDHRHLDKAKEQCAPTQSDAAVTSFAYGRGRSVYAGFDLLAQATQAGDTSLFAGLLRAATANVHPDPMPMVGGLALPLALHLENQGMAVSGRVVVTLPAGAQVISAGTGTVQADGTVIWPFDLAVGQTLDLPLLAIYPAGAQTLTAKVQTLSGGSYADYATVIHALTLTAAPTWTSVLTTANGLAAPRRGSEGYKQCAAELGKAKSAFDRKDYPDSVEHLTRAADPLKEKSAAEAVELRLGIDDLLREVGARTP